MAMSLPAGLGLVISDRHAPTRGAAPRAGGVASADPAGVGAAAGPVGHPAAARTERDGSWYSNSRPCGRLFPVRTVAVDRLVIRV